MIEVVRAELRKAAPFYVVTAFALLGYVVLKRPVLRATDMTLGALAVLHGLSLALALFSDPGHSRSFMFSRAMTRRKLFLTRWTTGLGLLALTLGLAAACIASGLREAVQVETFRSVYYPMAKWYDLTGLWAIGACALATYQVVLFTKTRAQALEGEQRTPAVLVTSLAGALLLPLGFVSARAAAGQHPSLPVGPWEALLWLYILTVCLLATASADSCYRNMEIEP